MLWILHSENVESITEHAPKNVRQYLTATGDFDALREWDKAKMSDRLDRNDQDD